MDFHTEFAMVLLFVYAFQNWDPFTNIHSNIQIYKRTYKLISWNQNIRIAHCMYRNRFIFNECISFIINDWKTWYPTVWYVSFLLSSIIFLPQLKWPHAHFLLSLFRVLQMKTSSLLPLQLLYIFQTNNSFNMRLNWYRSKSNYSWIHDHTPGAQSFSMAWCTLIRQ